MALCSEIRQTVGELCTFLRWQRKFKDSFSAAFGKIGEECVKAIYAAIGNAR
jgi:hypothetical protein